MYANKGSRDEVSAAKVTATLWDTHSSVQGPRGKMSDGLDSYDHIPSHHQLVSSFIVIIALSTAI